MQNVNGTNDSGVRVDKVSIAIATALVAAQGNIRPVEKAGTNAFFKYKFASSEDIITEARAALNGAGLALLRTGWHFEGYNDPTGPSIGRLFVTYLLVHKDGDSLALQQDVPVIPEKGRPTDKAEAAALSFSLGYLLTGLLQIPRKEANEVDERDDTRYVPDTPIGRPVKPEISTVTMQVKSNLGILATIDRAASITELRNTRPLIEELPEKSRGEAIKAYNAKLKVIETGATVNGGT